MNICDRVRKVRKEYLKLSQERFGEALGVSRDVIKNIEMDNLARPELKKPLYRLICKEFAINYDWLVNGNGEMLDKSVSSVIDELTEKYGFSKYARKMLECYIGLSSEQRKVIDHYVESVISACSDENTD